jgi:hypothetical protein
VRTICEGWFEINLRSAWIVNWDLRRICKKECHCPHLWTHDQHMYWIFKGRQMWKAMSDLIWSDHHRSSSRSSQRRRRRIKSWILPQYRTKALLASFLHPRHALSHILLYPTQRVLDCSSTIKKHIQKNLIYSTIRLLVQNEDPVINPCHPWTSTTWADPVDIVR